MTVSMQMMISVIVAIILGSLFGEVSWAMGPLKEIGGLFISLLKMCVVPLAFVCIASSIVRLDRGSKAGSITRKAFILMVGMSVVGVALGGLLMSIFTMPDVAAATGNGIEAKAPTVWEFIKNSIPVNPIKSLADGIMLQVIVFAIFFGAATRLAHATEDVAHLLVSLQSIFLKIANIVMYTAPVGVFALLYPLAAKSAGGLLLGYGTMVLALVVGSLLYMAFVCIPLLKCNGVPISFLKVILPGDVIGAVSGGATNYLAPRLERIKKTAINQEVIDYLLPLTAVLMRAGSCICVGIYTIFAANVYGISLSWEQSVLAILLSVIALTAAPGIIGGTLMDCAIVWAAIGIPLEAVALFAGVDYLMDVLRTVLNIQGGEIVTACVGVRKNSFSCIHICSLSKQNKNPPDGGLK